LIDLVFAVSSFGPFAGFSLIPDEDTRLSLVGCVLAVVSCVFSFGPFAGSSLLPDEDTRLSLVCCLSADVTEGFLAAALLPPASASGFKVIVSGGAGLVSGLSAGRCVSLVFAAALCARCAARAARLSAALVAGGCLTEDRRLISFWASGSSSESPWMRRGFDYWHMSNGPLDLSSFLNIKKRPC
jgi:hypothetical protein